MGGIGGGQSSHQCFPKAWRLASRLLVVRARRHDVGFVERAPPLQSGSQPARSDGSVEPAVEGAGCRAVSQAQTSCLVRQGAEPRSRASLQSLGKKLAQSCLAAGT